MIIEERSSFSEDLIEVYSISNTNIHDFNIIDDGRSDYSNIDNEKVDRTSNGISIKYGPYRQSILDEYMNNVLNNYNQPNIPEFVRKSHLGDYIVTGGDDHIIKMELIEDNNQGPKISSKELKKRIAKRKLAVCDGFKGITS